MERTRENTFTTHHFFVDFRNDYDSIIRGKLYQGMEKMNTPQQIDMSCRAADEWFKKLIQGDLSEVFKTIKGLR